MLAARRNDDGGSGWMQLLVFLVVIGFSVIPKIIRAWSQKHQQGESEEEPSFQSHRRSISRPKGPAGQRKILSHKMPQPTATTVTAAQPVKEETGIPFAITPEATKPEPETAAVEIIALEKHDELARGIIYSEILGKPLAMREPWEE